MTTATGKTEQLLHLMDTKLGTHKGVKRVWLEGKRLTDAGFRQGAHYSVTAGQGSLVLRLSTAGARKVSGTAQRPVVDILNHTVTEALGDVEYCQVRFSKRSITVTLYPQDARVRARLARLNARLAAGQKLRLGSLCHGGGVASDALLRGLGNAELAFAVEQDADYVAQSLTHGPLSAGGISVQASIGQLDASLLPEVEILEAGLPCTAASRAGRAKKALVRPEADANVGHLVYGFLRIIEATMPAVILLENVPEYADSASADIIRGQLAEWGYLIHEHDIDGSEWSLEARQRWALVAVTRGLDIDLGSLVGSRPAETVGEVLDKRTPAAAWRSTAALDAQLASAKEKGQGFARGRKLITAADTSVPTLRRGYQKGGKCDARLAHPSRPGMARLFSPTEHARIKGIPTALVAGLSDKKAHEVLGQSVISPAFTALGALIGAAVR